MTRRKTKLLFYVLLMFYVVYGFIILIFPEIIIMEMSDPIVEIYGLFSSFLILLSLYLYAFSKSIFHYNFISLIIFNTILCAVISYAEAVLNDFEYMTQAEIFVFTSIYLIIYPLIINSLFKLRSSELNNT